MRSKLYFSMLCLALSSAAGCKKFVKVGPPQTGLTSSAVFSSNSAAAATMTGVYSQMMSGGMGDGYSGLSIYGGLSADELTNYEPAASVLNQQLYTNSLSKASAPVWIEPYKYIYVANATIEGLGASSTVIPALKHQLTGEAKFIRAFMYFYLVNFVGDVPLATSTDYTVNNTAYRTPSAQVYQQVIADLVSAQSQLSDSYLSPAGASTSERVRPNKGAATALLARAYLYTGDWKDAEAQASAVIGNSNYALTGLGSVFLANSNEAVWQLQPVQPELNTDDAFIFLLTSGPNGSTPYALSPFLYNAFELGDQRFSQWVGQDNSTGTTYYYAYKYKVGYGQPVTEYTMVLRLAEQYLIRAEARAEQGELSGAQSDLNMIRNRAGLPNTTAATTAALLAAVQHERQVELFTEWGHRWLDLKRTGKVDSVMSVVTPKKGGTWNPDWALYPIPQTDISINPHLKQNPGY